MKVIIARLFEPRFPARYIGRHRAPFHLPVSMSSAVRRTPRAASAPMA